MKTAISIIGAGSATFSAGIVRDICCTPGLWGNKVTFMDIDEGRLDAIVRLAEKIAFETGAKLSFAKTTDRREALRGADFVINTVQIKAGALEGHQWVERQRDLAQAQGYYRGAKLHYIAQTHFMLELARDMQEICPKAWLLQSGNPVFEGCTLMHRETGIQVLGLCHGHYGYREIAQGLGLELEHVSAQCTGFNHWIWMTDFRYKGEDAYPLLDRWIETEAERYWQTHKPGLFELQLSRAAIHQYRLFGRMPIGDTVRQAGWWYHTDLETKKRWFGENGGVDSEIGWQEYLESLTERLAQIEKAATDPACKATDIFEPVQSDEQIVPIINALVNDVQGVYQVNIPNTGEFVQGFPKDLVVECSGVVNGAGVHGVKAQPLPVSVQAGAMIPRWREAEQVVECMRQRSYNLLLLYILGDHQTRSIDQAEALLKAWLGDPYNDRLRDYFK